MLREISCFVLSTSVCFGVCFVLEMSHHGQGIPSGMGPPFLLPPTGQQFVRGPQPFMMSQAYQPYQGMSIHQQFMESQMQEQHHLQMMAQQHAMRFNDPQNQGNHPMHHFHNPNRQPLGPIFRPGIARGANVSLFQPTPQAKPVLFNPQINQQFRSQLQSPQRPVHPVMSSHLQSSMEEESMTCPLRQEKAPSVAYFDLPAGLMVPLIKLQDWEYKPLDGKEVKLPVPAPPSDRLLKAVEAFYASPSHETPRNSEGWEQLALYDFYKDKHTATQGKAGSLANLPLKDHPFLSEDKIEKEVREVAKEDNEETKRRFREEKTTCLRSSHSPENKRRSSPSPERKPRHSKKSARMDKRSPSPEKASFASMSNCKLQESNKGHQLLKKMGWSGEGLGSSGQGMQEPIPAGEARDASTLYRGIGMQTADPFESYRRNRGQQFMDRIVKGKDEK